MEIVRRWIKRRDGIVTAAAPGLTTSESFQAEPASARNAVRLNRFQEISRAGRLKATTATRPAQRCQQGRERVLVETNENSNDQEHQAARIEARWARRNHSSSSA